MRIVVVLRSMSLVALAFAAPTAAKPSAGETRTSMIEVFGNDPCPKGHGDEIVVCSRLPENERYRIPKRFRDRPHDLNGASEAWGAKVEQIEAVTRFTMPGGCSTSGPDGQSGCMQKALHQWYLERHAPPSSDTP